MSKNGGNMNENMYFDFTDNKETVRILQNMLRTVSQADRREDPSSSLPLIGTDGIYDDGTREAVRQYQARKRLPVTGEVDPVTWDYISRDYEDIIDAAAPPSAISPFPSVIGYRVENGETSDLVLIIQIMLASLRLTYDGIGNVPLSGSYDTRTAAAVRFFRMKNLMPPESYVDLDTWNRLARQYNLYVNRAQ